MKISKAQQQEIDFLVKFYINENLNANWRIRLKVERNKLVFWILKIYFYLKGYGRYKPSQKDITEYIEWSVLGKKLENTTASHPNKLVEAKRKLDIDVKSWRNDIKEGLFYVQEFIDDFNDPYATRLFNGILKGIDFKFENAKSPVLFLANALRQKQP